ncbi:hypothetical protein J7413_13680 [Shimia sp. R10_1]|uniref:hypothetical protein n=1 Tax=Shimia sp. R10_1 TaxID=2821095 RepID=UPI001AD9FB61|nr:hypothetical protein [Shimia sp. R10_1]MBO9474596.1 hypothetical protein [Shimia sp. R10_1]
MNQIATLKMSEQAVVDHDELTRVLIRLDQNDVEETFMSLIKSLTDHLAMAERHYNADDLTELAETMTLVELIAGRLCMTALSRVAVDVIACCERHDSVALAATYARLIRIGECALREIWDLKRSYI